MTIFFACKKTEIEVQPDQEIETASTNKEANKSFAVTTTSISSSSAILTYAVGNVSSSGGGASVTERGFCYGTSAEPTIANDTARAGSGSGDFERLIEGLSNTTTYYLRAYAIKTNGDIYYGNELSFTTLSFGLPSPGVGTVTDIDNNVYNTITLGTQVWMVENLKTTKFRDGAAIPNITDNTAWMNTTSEAYCDYNNILANSAEYGRLYNLYAVKNSRGLAPAGWHVPNYAEWNTLFRYLGGAGVASGRMKEAGFAHWDSPNTGADNTSGLTALGSGYRTTSGPYYSLKRRALFWSSLSSIQATSLNIHAIILEYEYNRWLQQDGGFGGTSSFGYSVRCIKD